MASTGLSPSKRGANGSGGSAIASVTALQMRAAAPATPLDYSFMGLSTLSEMVQQDPVAGKKKPDTSSSGPSDEVMPTSTSHYSAVSLRVSNNKISNLTDMDEALAAVFIDPTKLQWIDLSGNALSSIPPTAFSKYPDVFTLHLHGNKLSRYTDVDNLAAWMPRVHSLTLHGNPIEEKKHYRSYVISSFPQLKQLDFSCVTKGDREKADTWAKIYKKALQAARHKGKHGVDTDLESI